MKNKQLRDCRGRFVKKEQKFFKIVDPRGHNGMIYKEGINTDIRPFNPSGDCEPGGLYFASTDIFAFLDYGTDVYEVEPIGEVYENPSYPKKYKAHSLKMKKIGNWTKDIKVLKYLVYNGADINADDDYALITAAKYGHLEVVKYLVEQGADINAEAEIVLCYAAELGHFEVVKYLVEQGADVSACNNYALRYAKTDEIRNYIQKNYK